MNEHIIRRSYNPMKQISSLTSPLSANLVYERNKFGELIHFRADQAKSHRMIRFASETLALHSYVEDSNSWVDVLGLSANTYRVRHSDMPPKSWTLN